MHRSATISARRRGLVRPGLIAGLLALGCLASGAALAAGSQSFAVPMPAPLPPVRVMTLLVALHLLGVCFGLGGATMLDFWILRWMRWGRLPAEIARIFLFVSKVVSVGLGLLWISGLGFLAVYAFESPDKLANPKLWAKVAIVVVLTVNGLVIHALVLPGVLRDIGRPMLEGVSGVRTGVFLVSGAISGVSWYSAFALGLLREFNGQVSGGLLLALWLAAVAAASLGAYLFWLHLREWKLRQIGAALRAWEPERGAPLAEAAAEPYGAAAPRIPADRILPLHPAALRA